MAAIATRIRASQTTSPLHAGERDEPPFLSHSKQIAHTLLPPSVNVQQLPQTG